MTELKSAMRRICRGKLTQETAAAIRAELGDNRIKAAVIGPAGEKLVRFAAIVDERRTASRGGVGAVMGSKNLKAVAVRGTQHPELADRAALMEMVKKQMERVKTDPRLQGFRKLGTAAAVGFCHELGIYPVRNFQARRHARGERQSHGSKIRRAFSARCLLQELPDSLRQYL